MPHIVVKLLAGRSEEQKSLLAAQLVKDVMAILNCGEGSVSVALEDIKAGDWAEKVTNKALAPSFITSKARC
jgi:4-oxalocrotonate tautomerase